MGVQAAASASVVDALKADSVIEGRIGKFLDTFEEYVAVDMPLRDTSVQEMPMSAVATESAAESSSIASNSVGANDAAFPAATPGEAIPVSSSSGAEEADRDTRLRYPHERWGLLPKS